MHGSGRTRSCHKPHAVAGLNGKFHETTTKALRFSKYDDNSRDLNYQVDRRPAAANVYDLCERPLLWGMPQLSSFE